MNTATGQKAPSQGEMLFCEISEDERRRIHKFFPFRDLRDRTILELREKGSTIRALSELSGLERATISKSIQRAKRKREAERLLRGRKKRR